MFRENFKSLRQFIQEELLIFWLGGLCIDRKASLSFELFNSIGIHWISSGNLYKPINLDDKLLVTKNKILPRFTVTSKR